MPKIEIHYKRVSADKTKYGEEAHSFNSLTQKEFESFNPSVLGLGDVSREGSYVQALAAFYDLEGFTDFCNQVDSHLVIPEFLQRFIDWLFRKLADAFKEGCDGNRVTIWGALPFYTKFLGDGILFLWDTTYCRHLVDMLNVIYILHEISEGYQADFLPNIKKHVSKPPQRLRCGVARGQIISVGDGSDYVGSCINIAARLQKLSQLTFAFSRRGLDISNEPDSKFLKQFVLRRVELRGIGSEELVYVKQNELRRLSPSERKLFRTL